MTANPRLPELPPDNSIEPRYLSFLQQLEQSCFTGDIDRRFATRMSLATDNSAFQQIPAAVLFPKSEADVQRVTELLARPEFHDVYLAPRGGGTSTIGCSLTAGLVLDCSRHMNRILDIDIEAGEVTVQPGVVLDQLNDTLAPYGCFFAPNVAPSSRATLGGMTNTDGCGKGSRIYGKTSDHILASRVVLTDGSAQVIDSRPSAPEPDSRITDIKQQIADIINRNRDEIERVFPDLSRYLSGYNLAQAVDGQGRCHINKLLGGSEGTLAIVSELTLKLTPVPDTRVLYALHYPSFDAALRDAETLVHYNPGAIESIDEKVMGLARDNPIYERVRDYIEAEDGSTPSAVNLLEFTGHGGLPEGSRKLDAALQVGTGKSIGHYRAESPEAIAALWDLRKAGVGLLGSTPGARKPLPFVEDTVVDPRVLADYVIDFRAILDEYGLSYGMFGHIDVGCLHVRPALDLTDPVDEAAMRDITTRVGKLAESYGGLLWNEHGKGFRSEYNRPFFGERLYGALADVKRVFDPHNQLNPGKIVALNEQRLPLAAMDAPTRGTYDRQIKRQVRSQFPGAMNCNGNGACFSYDPAQIMCPSYRATRDRVHSPKGRAGLMREWLRQLAESDIDATGLPARTSPLAFRALHDWLRGGQPSDRQDDFSCQVHEAMDGCLGCRACATQCPVRVDVPRFKSEFLALYHGKNARPLADYALALLERGASVGSKMPRLANALLGSRHLVSLLDKSFGLVDPPPLSVPTLAGWLRKYPQYRYSAKGWAAMSQADRQRTVLIVQDAFTSFFDAQTVIAVIELIALLGYRPQLLPFIPGGKPLHAKGFMPEFSRAAKRFSRFAQPLIDTGRPLVGIEPSTTLSFKLDYLHVLGHSLPIRPLEDWLAEAVQDISTQPPSPGRPYRLFNHCTSESQSSDSSRHWQSCFHRLGLDLTTAQVGCCGMSGVYGHESRHRQTSATVFKLSWDEALAEPGAIQIAAGYSCRSQCARLSTRKVLHPALILRDHLQTAKGH